MIGTSDQSCWLAEACKILLLLGTVTEFTCDNSFYCLSAQTSMCVKQLIAPAETC